MGRAQGAIPTRGRPRVTPLRAPSVAAVDLHCLREPLPTRAGETDQSKYFGARSPNTIHSPRCLLGKPAEAARTSELVLELCLHPRTGGVFRQVSLATALERHAHSSRGSRAGNLDA